MTNEKGASKDKEIDSGFFCLLMLAQYHSVQADEVKLRHNYGYEPFNDQKILRASKDLGLSARLVKQGLERIDRSPFPVIAIDNEKKYFIVGAYDKRDGNSAKLLTQKPNEAPQSLDIEHFNKIWSGYFIFITSKANYIGELAKFDFSWFIPAVVKYRRMLIEILFVSFILQCLGLVTPLFFQVIMDKVLVNRALSTLDVMAFGFFVSIVFEILLTSGRSYLFSHTSSKIDVELGARLFRHMLNLPIAYFQARRVGDSVARVRELENIRSFLTGNAMTIVLDLLFSIVFILVMLTYSLKLTVIVITSIPLYAMLSIFLTPILRKKLDDKFNKYAENQSFLVESVSGVETIKAMAVEPRWVEKWEKQLAAYVSSSLSANNVGNVANSGVQFISKLTTLSIMWFGVSLVLNNELTVGELIAFNMFSGQVASPIIRLAQLWNDFQQIGISMNRLGDILNARQEIVGGKSRMPRIEGGIEFDQVFFRYRPESADVIRSLSLKVLPGEVVGIVGRSGSGKSTLTKLVQRLFVPDRGRVLIDGQDISIVDTVSLRSQVGVVLQENVLFNRSIKDNIALTYPAASIEVVINTAKLAGAHEFICELSEGYDTMVGEHGIGLSGGQRQRVAIARALLTNPRILIFDEATSALDYESEKIIQNNMKLICKGRTVLIIAHRLSAVRDAKKIIVMERGQIVESGSHDELLKIENGHYRKLYQLQSGND